jgi:thiosulfate/3-mercaptopyruvate sulfurtransferase
MIVRLVDCRPRDAYLEGHVPGAVHLDPESDLTGEIGDASRGRHPLPEADEFATAATRAGIGPGVFALAYDDGSGWASRCWWLLRHFGHDDAGSFDMRHYQGRSESGERPRRDPFPVADFEARPRNDDTIEAEELHARLGDPGLLVLDARSEPRWRGDEEPLDPVAGRIPGAQNAFFEEAVPDEAFAAPELAIYCGSGVTAAVQVQRLVLAGREDARLYPGSFSEWCRRQGYPVEKGDP